MDTAVRYCAESKRNNAALALRDLRLASGLPQAEIVARVRREGYMGLTQAYLSRLENGIKTPRPRTLAVIRGCIELILVERLGAVRRLLASSCETLKP
jgi:transcriptional regulator with XRE-family HTH domain